MIRSDHSITSICHCSSPRRLEKSQLLNLTQYHTLRSTMGCGISKPSSSKAQSRTRSFSELTTTGSDMSRSKSVDLNSVIGKSTARSSVSTTRKPDLDEARNTNRRRYQGSHFEYCDTAASRVFGANAVLPEPEGLSEEAVGSMGGRRFSENVGMRVLAPQQEVE
jgi:hypothetical protein